MIKMFKIESRPLYEQRPINQAGVTLIELMIVIAIIGVIAAVSVPAYLNQTAQARRTDGTSELTRIMDLQERFYINNFPPTYTTNLTQLGLPSAANVATDNGHYQITATACAGGITACVLLTATPPAGGAQVADGTLTLNSRGQRMRGTAVGWD